MLTEPAFNALLKTLEEPPPHIVFILATTDAHKVPATIVSRCQRFEFRRIPLAAMVDRLAYIAEQEGITIPRDGLELIARERHRQPARRHQPAGADLRLVRQRRVARGCARGPGPRSATSGRRSWRMQRWAATSRAGWRRSAPCATTASTCGSSRRKSCCACANCCWCSPARTAAAPGRRSRSRACARPSKTCRQRRIVRALKAFGAADLRADPLSPLPLELALAESIRVGAVAAAPRPRRARRRPPRDGRTAARAPDAGTAAAAAPARAPLPPARPRPARPQQPASADRACRRSCGGT